MNIKCLPLPNWCIPSKWINTSADILECFERYYEITPIVKRPGWYYLNKEEWYEVELDGELRAFKDPKPGMFLYELSMLNHIPLSVEEEKVFRYTIRLRKNKQLSDLVHIDNQWKSLRDTRRSGMKHLLEFRKK